MGARLAEEYDAAQERGEVVGPHDGARKRVPDENAISPATAADIGLSRKDIHEARQIRRANPTRIKIAGSNTMRTRLVRNVLICCDNSVFRSIDFA